MAYAEVGIISGSGFYEMPGIEDASFIELDTPFGPPSDRIMIGRLNNRTAAFLNRHGEGHCLSPTEVNYRANLYAMKTLNVERLISITAVGSLKEELRPKDLVIPDQYIDNTYKREKTYFEKGIVAHVSMAEPTCSYMSNLAFECAQEIGLQTHLGGTYYNMEGPQFSTKQESRSYRTMGYSVIGMTQAVEAKLARELEFCFLPLAFITDYDCWHHDEESVTVEMILENLGKNRDNARTLINSLMERMEKERNLCDCQHTLANAIVSDTKMIPEHTYERLKIIIGKYVKTRLDGAER